MSTTAKAGRAGVWPALRVSLLSIILGKEGVRSVYFSYLSAQEASCPEGARFPRKNVHKERPQGSCPPQSKGQSEALLLIHGIELTP